jgi:UDP-N-acetylglucosamine acyltransferase
VDGESSCVVGLNVIGLRRAGLTSQEVSEIKAAYRVLYRSDLMWADILVALRERFASGPAALLAEFVQRQGRGVTPERRGRSTTLRLADYRDKEGHDTQERDTEASDTHERDQGRRATDAPGEGSGHERRGRVGQAERKAG